MRGFVVVVPLRADGGPNLGMAMRRLIKVGDELVPDPDATGKWLFRRIRPGVFSFQRDDGQEVMRLHKLGNAGTKRVFVGWGTRPKRILKHLDGAKFRSLKDAWARPAWKTQLTALGIGIEVCAECGNDYPVTPSHPAGHPPASLAEHAHDSPSP